MTDIKDIDLELVIEDILDDLRKLALTVGLEAVKNDAEIVIRGENIADIETNGEDIKQILLHHFQTTPKNLHKKCKIVCYKTHWYIRFKKKIKC